MLRNRLPISLIFILAFSGLCPLGAQITASFKYKIKLDEVIFLAPIGLPDYKVNLLNDVYPNPNITGPNWKAPNTKNPVAYVNNIKARVKTKFDLFGCTQPIWAKGDGPGAFDLPPQQLSSDGEYPAAEFAVAFPNHKVLFFEDFEITWYISTSGSGPWLEVGKSSNPLYVLYRNTPLSSSFPAFHSLIYYGCKNANGLSNEGLIVDEMYNKTFTSTNTGLTLPRKDSPTKPAMSYWIWPDPDPSQNQQSCYFETIDLLHYENGRCGSWANFFLDMITAQGISGAEIATVFYVPPSWDDFNANYLSAKTTFFGVEASNVKELGNALSFPPFFFVNNFNFGQAKFYTWNQEWNPYPNQSTTPIPLANGNVLTFAPASGAAAQGNGDPMSSFQDHALVKYGGKYYDPSYGSPIQSSKNNWETPSLAGFGEARNLVYVYEDPGSGIFKLARIMYLSEINTATLQTTIEP